MSEPATNPAACSFPSPVISLPMGKQILRTSSGILICLEIAKDFNSRATNPSTVFGGLVWILVASSDVPVPLLQGWVMFVSVSAFFLSSFYLGLLISATADRIVTDWNLVDVMYHFIAFLFYVAAFVLEAASTAANGGINILPNSTDVIFCITNPVGNIFTIMDTRQYNINVAATIFALVVTLCYFCSMLMGFKRWRM